MIIGVGRVGGHGGSPGGINWRRCDRARRGPGGCSGPAVFRRPTSGSHVMTFCHAPFISCANLENETYGRFDAIFFLSVFLTSFGAKMKKSLFIKGLSLLAATRFCGRFSKSAKNGSFFWG